MHITLKGDSVMKKILVKYIWELSLYYIMYFPIYMLPMA